MISFDFGWVSGTDETISFARFDAGPQGPDTKVSQDLQNDCAGVADAESSMPQANGVHELGLRGCRVLNTEYGMRDME